MKLTIHQIPKDTQEEIILCCHDPADSWVKAVQSISGGQLMINGTSDKKVHRIRLSDIYYFEVVDGESFFTAKRMYIPASSGSMNLSRCAGVRCCFDAASQ